MPSVLNGMAITIHRHSVHRPKLFELIVRVVQLRFHGIANF